MDRNKLEIRQGNESLNYIVQSSLNHFNSDSIAQNYSIKYVKTESEYYILDGKRYRLVGGQFLVVNPNQQVQIEVESVKNAEGSCFFFDPFLLSEIQNSKKKSLAWNLENAGAEIDQIELANIPICSFGTPPDNLMKDKYINELNSSDEVSDYLFLLAEKLVSHQFLQSTQLDKLESKNDSTKKELFKRIQLGRTLIHDGYKENLTLNDIAKTINLSAYYFHRSFRLFFNQTPHQYLQNIRMVKAHELLAEKKAHTMSEVAFTCGFNDPKYFRKAYKKWLTQSRII